MGLRYTVDASGADALERQLAHLLKRMGDLFPLMRIISGYLRDETRQRFEDGEAPDGSKWKTSIRAQVTGGQTLVDRGILRDSITDAATRDSAIVRTKAARALVFQLAGSGWKTVKQVVMPARPIFGLSAASPGEIGGIINDYLAGAVR